MGKSALSANWQPRWWLSPRKKRKKSWQLEALNVKDGRPHLFHNLPLPSRFLHHYQLILLGGRDTKVWQTCLRFLHSSALTGIEPATSWLLVRRSTHSGTALNKTTKHYFKKWFSHSTVHFMHRNIIQKLSNHCTITVNKGYNSQPSFNWVH